MQDNNVFSNADLLYMFLDGETDDVQQAVLFGALATDAELQDEFRDAMQLRMAAEVYKPQGTPPENVTNSVFAHIGIPAAAAPNSAISPPAVGGVLGGLIAGLNPGGLALFSAIAGAVITLLATMPLWNAADFEARHDTAAESSKIIAGETGEAATHSTEESASSTPMPSLPNTMESPAVPATAMPVRGSGADEHYSALRNQDAGLNITAESNGEQTMQHQENARYALRPASLRKRNEPLPQITALRAGADPVFLPDRQIGATGPGRFAVLAGGSLPAAWFPRANSRVEGARLLTDFNTGLLYHLNNRHSVGIEGGQMSLPLYIREGEEYALKSHLAWAGATYQYRLQHLNILDGIQPYAQVTIGGSRSGPLFRSVVGLRINPRQTLSFGLGAETLLQLYRNDGPWQGTGRLGLTATLFFQL